MVQDEKLQAELYFRRVTFSVVQHNPLLATVSVQEYPWGPITPGRSDGDDGASQQRPADTSDDGKQLAVFLESICVFDREAVSDFEFYSAHARARALRRVPGYSQPMSGRVVPIWPSKIQSRRRRTFAFVCI